MSADKRQIFYLKNIRVISCIAIVILHTFYAAYSYASDFSAKVVCLSLKNVMTFAVPCFLMVTGALLLNPKHEITLEKIYKKYIPRVLVALLAFSIIFEIIDSLIDKSLSINCVFYGLKNAILGESWSHLWYIYLIIAIYIILPFFRQITAHSSQKEILYLLLIYVIFQSIVPLLETITGLDFPFYICTYTVYPLYIFLGYALNNGTLKIGRMGGIIMFFTAALINIILTVVSLKTDSSDLASTLQGLLSNYSFPSIILEAIGFYAMVKKDNDAFLKGSVNVIQAIDPCTFGIYIVHMIFLKLVFVAMKFNPFALNISGNLQLLVVLGVSIGVFIVSFAVIWVLKKIPAVKNII